MPVPAPAASTSIDEVRSLLRREEYLMPLLEKAYRSVRMKSPVVALDDFKLFLKHFSEQCGVPSPSATYLVKFVDRLKDKNAVSQDEFVLFFKQYLASLVPPQKK